MRGKVSRYSDFRGYGFIVGEDSIDYFVHVSQVAMDGFKTLVEGQGVEFQPYKTAKGWQAKNVHIMGQDQARETAPTTVLKRNPFSPQDPIVDPAKFAGRGEAVTNSVYALYNNNNVLITGPRGIGKSSLAYQLLYLTQGEKALLDRLNIQMNGFEFDYICGDHRCVPGNTLADIADGLLHTLQGRLKKFDQKKGTTFSLELNLAFFKGRYEAESVPVRASELATHFVAEVTGTLHSLANYANGISFLIDEIDVLEDKVDIAPFLKAIIEKFRMDQVRNVSFIVSGVTGTTTTLISQHQSSSRLFETLPLQHMTDDELDELLDVTLDGSGVSISEDAKSRILGGCCKTGF